MSFHPELDSYRGLSGLDTAFFALLITRAWLNSIGAANRLQSIAILGLWLAMLSKSLFEFVTGGVMFVDSHNFIPIPVAHLVGIICGTLTALSHGFVGRSGGFVRRPSKQAIEFPAKNVAA
jgi:hypothetical protein